MSQSVIGALRVNLGLDSAAFSKGAKQAQSQAKRLGQSLQKIGAGASAVGAGIVLAVRGQLNAADQIAKSAQKIGITVEELSALQHAAKLSGASMADLETGIRRLSRNMVDQADRFAELGINLRDSAGNARPTIEVMKDFADVLAGMPDGFEKTALAAELGGRSFANLIPLMNQGRGGIEEMMTEAQELGLVLSTDAAKGAEQFNDNLARLQGQIGGFVRIITAELVPILVTVSDAVVDFAKRFSGLSPEVRKFSAIATVVTVVLGPILLAIGGLLAVLGPLGIAITAGATAVSLIAAAFAAWWPELLALEERIQAFQREAVAALVDAFNSALEFLQSLPARFREMGGQIIQGLVSGIRERAAAVRDAVVGVAEGARDWFADRLGIDSPSKVFMQFGRDLLQGLADGITGNRGAPIRSLKDVLDRILGILDQFTSQIIDGAIGGLIGGLFKGFGGSGGGSVSLSDVTTSFGGFRASGGPVSGGTSYVVGERGPELFTPRQSGSIVPGAGARMEVNVIDQRGRNAPPIETRSRQDGNRQIRDFIIREVGDATRRGRLDDSFGEAFGARRQPVGGS